MNAVRPGIAALLLLIGLAGQASAQDQTLLVAQPLRLCTSVPLKTSPLKLTPDDAKKLITEALGAGAPNADTYYMLHVVKYVDGRMIVESQDWYVYFQPWMGPKGMWATIVDPRIKKHFEEARIFGSHKVAMVYLHMNVSTASTTTALDAVTKAFQPTGADATDAKALANARTRAGQYLQGLQRGDNEVTSELTLVDSKTGEAVIGLSGDLLTTATYGQLASLTYKVAVTKKVPAPLQNFKALGAFVSGHGGAKTAALDVTPGQSLCAGQELRIEPLPSDMAVSAMVGEAKEERELSKQLFDNERKYNVDFSFALPLKSHDDLSLDSSGGSITAKKVEKTDLFAVVNLSPWPYDTKKAHFQLLPVFLYGLPITGKPMKHHLAAIAIGLNRAQLFAGWRFDRKEAASASEAGGVTTGTLTAPDDKKWNVTFTWGLNMPVTTVVELFKAKK